MSAPTTAPGLHDLGFLEMLIPLIGGVGSAGAPVLATVLQQRKEATLQKRAERDERVREQQAQRAEGAAGWGSVEAVTVGVLGLSGLGLLGWLGMRWMNRRKR